MQLLNDMGNDRIGILSNNIHQIHATGLTEVCECIIEISLLQRMFLVKTETAYLVSNTSVLLGNPLDLQQ